MTKGPGEKHFQREDHEHAAHQAEVAPKHDDATTKKGRAAARGKSARDGHPTETAPKGPRRGQ